MGNKPIKYRRQGHHAWAIEHMTMRRFKQFFAALRVEFDPTDMMRTQDKAYQLRRMCANISRRARHIYIVGRYLSHDEGGVGCRSRLCPITMYNKDKPEKYRLDFFILCCAKTFIILHIEPYQGKNGTNAGVSTLARAFPVTSAAVLNAVERSGLKKSPDGYRILVADNRYMSPTLAVTLREHYHIAAIGTVRKNRKGIDKEIVTMTKREERGAIKTYYDKAMKVLLVQWNDNKVVTMLSSAWFKGMVDIQRRVGSELRTFQTESIIRNYQLYMQGVDRIDQIRVEAGGCRNSTRPNKWYKAGILGLLDFAMAQARQTWNLRAAEVPTQMKQLTHKDFLHCLTDQLLHLDNTFGQARPSRDTTPSSLSQTTPSSLSQTTISSQETISPCSIEDLHEPYHLPQTVPGNKRKRYYCRSCLLEKDYREMWGLKASKGEGGERDQTNMSFCRGCNVYAHNTVPQSTNRLIFSIQEFKNLSCFEILHSELCKDLLHHAHGTKRQTTLNKKHDLLDRLKQLYQDKYGDPTMTYAELKASRKEKRKRRFNAQSDDGELDVIAEVENETTFGGVGEVAEI